MQPTVSINLCCYNSEKYLRETIDSVIKQTCKDWELVIINDGSKDSTEAIVHDYIQRGHPIRYIYQENHGLGYSRNKALEHSSGEFIAFLDHDDLWVPEKLAKQVSVMRNNQDVDFVYSNYYKLTTYTGKRLALGFKDKQPEGMIFFKFLYSYQVGLSSVMISRRSLNSLDSLFDERFQHIEEFDVFMRVLYKHKASYIDEPLSVWRIHKNMGTMRSPERGPKEIQFLLEKFNHMDPLFAKKYPKDVEYIEVQLIKYSVAKYDILNGRSLAARSSIAPHKWYSIRLFLAYLSSFFPQVLIKMMNESILFMKRIH
ncbi:MAG: glycosyltransferase [Bacteroidota bacterium]